MAAALALALAHAPALRHTVIHTGAATRLQWGVTYLLALLDLAPHDVPRSDRAAALLAAVRAGTSASLSR